MATFNVERRWRDLRLEIPPVAGQLESGAGGRLEPAYRVGLVIIGGLTVWWLGWLIYRWLADPGWLAALPALLMELVLLAETAGGFTLALLWGGLGFHYWRRTRRPAGSIPALAREELYGLSPKAFERYVAGLFRQKGYGVVVRGRSGDLGVDLELTDKHGRRAIVQCKRYRDTVGAEVVRELYGTLIHEQVAHAFLVTTADVSEAAREWAQGKPMTLIDGALLVEIADALRSRLD